MVSGRKPNTLRSTHRSVEKLRQMISFSAAMAMKKRPQRKVRMRQPASVRWNAIWNSGLRNGLPSAKPPRSAAANKR